MAINRGEDLKVLTVKVNVPHRVKDDLEYHVRKNMVHQNANGQVTRLIQESFDDAYTRLIQPLISRRYR